MSDGLDTSPLERMQARFNDVRTKLRDWMVEQQTPWKIPCRDCGGERFLNLDASVNKTMREQQFAVVYFACKCWKRGTKSESDQPEERENRATHPDP